MGTPDRIKGRGLLRVDRIGYSTVILVIEGRRIIADRLVAPAYEDSVRTIRRGKTITTA